VSCSSIYVALFCEFQSSAYDALSHTFTGWVGLQETVVSAFGKISAWLGTWYAYI
jgi:hypothetical protein